jgi:hypothetical protein
LFGLQRAFTFCAFDLCALGLNHSVALGLLCTFGLTDFLLRSFDLAGSLDRTALDSACCSRCQPFCQRRVSGLCAKLFQRDLPRLGRGLLSLDEIRLLKTSYLFSTLYSILHGLPWLGGFSCVQFSTHAPAEDCSFDWAAGIHTAPSTATPSAQKWNDIGADVILAKNFKRLVCRRNTLVSEGVDSFLPCHHAVSIFPVVMNLMRTHGAAMASRRAYIRLTSA